MYIRYKYRCSVRVTGDFTRHSSERLYLFVLLLGDFLVTVGNISKDKYHATPIKRSVKSVLQAQILGLPIGATVFKSELEWRLVSEAELAASESAEGKLISEGTAEWIISKRYLSPGIYQVKFKASVTIGDPASPKTLQAFDYGFMESVADPLRTIIDGGSTVRWGSTENVTVDGSLSYDSDIGPGTHTGLNFTWSCADSSDNLSLSYNCFGAFANENANTSAIIVDTTVLEVGKTYILKLTLTKDIRSTSAIMYFEIAAGEIPQVTLRCVLLLKKRQNEYKLTYFIVGVDKYSLPLSTFGGLEIYPSISKFFGKLGVSVLSLNSVLDTHTYFYKCCSYIFFCSYTLTVRRII